MLYQTIPIHLPSQTYPVYLGHALLEDGELLSRHIQGKQVMIVTQKELADPHLQKLSKSLAAYSCDLVFLPSGERYKNLSAWQKIIRSLIEKRHERSTTLIALGGGIVGDVTGFAAACYLRGVNYLQIPTTLIAQVDSAIGGKTGVNHAAGKNLIGAFHHPQCVIADIATLQTLARREFIAGFAEVIKYGLIQDRVFLAWLEVKMTALLQADTAALLQAIATSVTIKSHLVAQDDREQSGVRSLLNFGHSFGHALEALFGYRRFLHGEAVAIGMHLASRLSQEKGWLDEKEVLRIQELLAAALLPLEVTGRFNVEKFFAYLKQDKKMHEGQSQFVLLKALGEAVLTKDVSEAELKKIIPH